MSDHAQLTLLVKTLSAGFDDLRSAVETRMDLHERNLEALKATQSVMTGLSEEHIKTSLERIEAQVSKMTCPPKDAGPDKPRPTKANAPNWFASMYKQDAAFRRKYANVHAKVPVASLASIAAKFEVNSEDYLKRVGREVWAELKKDKKAELEAKEYRKSLGVEEPNEEVQPCGTPGAEAAEAVEPAEAAEAEACAEPAAEPAAEARAEPSKKPTKRSRVVKGTRRVKKAT